MGQENVEIAKRAMDAFNRVDIELFITLTTTDFEWSPSMVAIEGQIFRGSEGIRAYFASLSDAWKEFLIIPGTFRDVGDVVIMLGGLRGRGQNSDVTVDSSLGMVIELRRLKISRIRGFLDHAEALRAAGAAE
jgi:ketosteroid isomerase-like protein